MRQMILCSAYQCQVAPLQLTVNFGIRHSGEPSCLSLRKQWIFRLAFPNDIDKQNIISSAHLRYRLYESILRLTINVKLRRIVF